MEKLSHSRLIKDSIKDHINELAERIDFDTDSFSGTRVNKIGNKTYKATLDLGKRECPLIVTRESGMNDYLQKPFKQKQLLDILEMWLPVRT